MKRKLFFIPIILIVAFIQITVLDWVALFGIKPDLLLLVVIVCGLYFSPGWALGYSIVAGCCKDLFTAVGWGNNIVLFSALSLLLVALHKRIRFDNKIVRVSVVYLSYLAYYCVSGLFLPQAFVVPKGIFLRIVFLGPLYGTLVFFWFLPWIEKALKPFAMLHESDEETDFDPDFETYV